MAKPAPAVDQSQGVLIAIDATLIVAAIAITLIVPNTQGNSDVYSVAGTLAVGLFVASVLAVRQLVWTPPATHILIRLILAIFVALTVCGPVLGSGAASLIELHRCGGSSTSCGSTLGYRVSIFGLISGALFIVVQIIWSILYPATHQLADTSDQSAAAPTQSLAGQDRHSYTGTTYSERERRIGVHVDLEL